MRSCSSTAHPSKLTPKSQLVPSLMCVAMNEYHQMRRRPANRLLQLIQQQQLRQLSTTDDLTDYLVPLTAATAAPRPCCDSVEHQTQISHPSTDHVDSSTQLWQLDVDTASHVFELLGGYPQSNRISKYLSLDVCSVWEQVKRQSQFTLTTLSETEKSDQTNVTFERGDEETRIRLVLNEIRSIAKQIKNKQSKERAAAMSTPMKPPLLARVSSVAAAVPNATNQPTSATTPNLASPFQSQLLTHELFADELQFILPVLYLKCRNANPNVDPLADEEEHDFATLPDRPTVDAASSATQPAFSSSFIPLRDLLLVLLHQGPVVGARLLTLIATSKPQAINDFFDAVFALIDELLCALRDKLYTQSLTLASMLHNPAQLAVAAQQIWQQAYAAVHAPPFSSMYALLLSLSSLSQPSTALYVRTRIITLMEDIKLQPPQLTPPTTAMLPQLPSSSVHVSPNASASAATAAAQSTPAGKTTQNRSGNVPSPITVAPILGRPAVPAPSTAMPYATPSFLNSMLANCWSPLLHYLPSITIAVTVHYVADEIPFLASIFTKLNGSSRFAQVCEGDRSSAQQLMEYLRDARSSEEFTDVITSVVNTTTAAAAAAATAALHEKASKARSQESTSSSTGGSSATASAATSSLPDSARKRKSMEATRTKDRAKGGATATTPSPSATAPNLTPTSNRTTSVLSSSSTSTSTPNSRPNATPGTSPLLSSTKASSSTISQGVPSLSIGSPSKPSNIHPSGGSSSSHALGSPTLHSVQYRDLLLTPRSRALAGPLAAASAANARGISSTTSVFQYGSVDDVKQSLLHQLELARDEFEATSQSENKRFRASTLLEIVRLIKLYNYLLLYCNFSIRGREVELLLQLIPENTQELRGCSATQLDLLSQMYQYLLAFLCINPHMTTHVSTTVGSRVTYWSQCFTALDRMKRVMRILANAQLHLASNAATAEKSQLFTASFHRGVIYEHLLFQASINAHLSGYRPVEMQTLLRSLLALPSHFKPSLLSPHADRISPHLREMQQSMLCNAIWPKLELLGSLFQFELPHSGTEENPLSKQGIFQRCRITGMNQLRSNSPFLQSLFQTMLSNASYFIRPSVISSASLLPRPFFEFGVGFWWQQLLLLRTRDDAVAAGEESISPLMSHPMLFHLCDSLAMMDLSAAIIEQQHLQPTSAQHHTPSLRKHDGRLLRENEMKDVFHRLLTVKGGSAQEKNSGSLIAPNVNDLVNPTGLAVALYYFLYYNSLVLSLWSKCIPTTPVAVSVLVPSKQANTPVEDITMLPLPPAGSKESASNYLSVYSSLGLPPPPFSPSFASYVSTASALHPYPPHMLQPIPLRGIMEYLKEEIVTRSSAINTSGKIPLKNDNVILSNLSNLFFNLYRLVYKFYPETLIGFQIAHVEALKAQSGILQDEGSLAMLGVATPEVKQEVDVVSVKTENDSSTATSSSSPFTSTSSSNPFSIAQLHERLQLGNPSLREALQYMEKYPNSISASGIEQFVLHILRPIVQQSHNMSRDLLQAISKAWFQLYSSTASSSTFVYHTLICFTSAAADHHSSWQSLLDLFPLNEIQFDPLSFFAGIPEILYTTPTLLQIFFAAFFHLLVSSTSLLTLVGKAEYVSSQIVRQATYQSNHSAWLKALKMLSQGVNPNEKKSGAVIHADPIVLTLQKEVEKAARDVFNIDKKAKKEQPAHSEETEGKAVKKMKTEEAGSNPAVAAPNVKKEDDARVKEEEMMEDEDKLINDSNISNSSGASVPRPFSYLIAERLLTSGEQLIFSHEFALANPSNPPSATGVSSNIGGSTNMDSPSIGSVTSNSISSPTLRTFIYLLTTRAAIVQDLLNMILRIVQSGHVDEDHRESVRIIMQFIELLFAASTNPASNTPSSLFLLLHVQSYPIELLPMFLNSFAAPMQALFAEPVVRDRVIAGTSPSDPVEAMEQNLFVQLLALTLHSPQSKATTDSGFLTDPKSTRRLVEAIGVWNRLSMIHPSAALAVGELKAALQNRVQQLPESASFQRSTLLKALKL